MKDGVKPRQQGTQRLVLVNTSESAWLVITRALGRQGFALVNATDVDPAALPAALAGAAPAELEVYRCLQVSKVARGTSGPGHARANEPRPEELTAGTLAAGVAHEINNPLAAVMANLDMALINVDRLADKDRSSAPAAGPASPAPMLSELRAELADAREAALHVRQIVSAVREFCRPDDQLPEAIDVRDAVELSLRMAANELRSRARLVKECGVMPPVRTTALRLGQVFVNLLINAAQAIEVGNPGAHEVRIVTRTDEQGWASVAISDSGMGIPQENLARVFVPFFTTKPAGVGSGLGLAICQRIVEELGGRIELQSRPGQGTTVTVSLPPAPGSPGA